MLRDVDGIENNFVNLQKRLFTHLIISDFYLYLYRSKIQLKSPTASSVPKMFVFYNELFVNIKKLRWQSDGYLDFIGEFAGRKWMRIKQADDGWHQLREVY